jgi:hypothetical protein
LIVAIREEVSAFVALCPLPSDTDATAGELAGARAALFAIRAPVSDDEARELLTCFGRGDDATIAGTLVQLVETCPAARNGTLILERPAPRASVWLHRIWERARQRG